VEYINRAVENKFLRLSNFFKVMLITGARQVGKTTVLQHLARDTNRTFISLDDSEARKIALSDPVGFFNKYKPPIIIDEVQYAPNLFIQIKKLCDESDLRGQFWLTGSQKYLMMKNITESLAGRIGILELHSFSRAELNGCQFSEPLTFNLESLLDRADHAKPTDKSEIFQRIWHGGMPQILRSNAEERTAYFDSYINSYLLRDALEIGGISDIVKFKKFLICCANLTAGQLNMSNLSRIALVSQEVARTWLQFLESMHIIYLLQPYFTNQLKSLVKMPKLYFWDTGLCSYLARYATPESLQNSNASGAFFETFVIGELLKGYAYSSVVPEVGYFRNSRGDEIDLLVQTDQYINPLEIKLSAKPDAREIKKFKIIEDAGFKLGAGGIICMCDEVSSVDEHNFIIPIKII
jgi:predicted AAA+ superfamily ATPase